jgi:hypothetical protein
MILHKMKVEKIQKIKKQLANKRSIHGKEQCLNFLTRHLTKKKKGNEIMQVPYQASRH